MSQMRAKTKTKPQAFAKKWNTHWCAIQTEDHT